MVAAGSSAASRLAFSMSNPLPQLSSLPSRRSSLPFLLIAERPKTSAYPVRDEAVLSLA
jgi:hypothetical protein